MRGLAHVREYCSTPRCVVACLGGGGSYLMIARNPQTTFGIARDCEREAGLEAALKHYRLASVGRNKLMARLARQNWRSWRRGWGKAMAS
jgi:hypothetical protein